MKKLAYFSVVLLSSMGFSILATAKYHTKPRCFHVFYGQQTQRYIPDWDWAMVIFYVTNTPLLIYFAGAIIVFIVFTVMLSSWIREPFSKTLHPAVISISPLVFLLYPALYWSDIPGTAWFIHRNYHDGHGLYPFWFMKPRYLGVLSLLSMALGLMVAKWKKSSALTAV
jgi:hypothetical protein